MAAKYQILAGLLREEIYRASSLSGFRLPTEAELCQRYHMSRQTVRHALQVLIDEGLITRRQGSGSFTTGKTIPPEQMQIAVITSYVDDYIFPALLHDMQNVLAQRGYSIRVYTTDNEIAKEREILQQLLKESVCGILAEAAKSALPSLNGDLITELAAHGVPIVYFHSRHAEPENAPFISNDNFGGGQLLARYLVSQGHTKIGGIFKSDDMQGPQRFHGVISVLRDAMIPVSDRRFCWYDTAQRSCLVDLRDPYLLRRFLQDGLFDATAIVCYNDEIAYCLIQQLSAIGKRVPEDVSVVSFDNSYFSQLGPVGITSLWHRRQHLGQVAAEELLRQMISNSGQSRQLSWELVPRQSSQPPHKEDSI